MIDLAPDGSVTPNNWSNFVIPDFDTFVSSLKSIERRLDLSDDDLLELFWQAHPRFQFFKTLPWDANMVDIGAAEGGLGHWKSWGRPPRPDLKLYGVDLDVGQYSNLYAAWEAINLDERLPEFPGARLNGFFTTHLIEHLSAPDRLIKWIAGRAEPGAAVYIEWPNPTSVDLPKREKLLERGIEVTTSNFWDDDTHKNAPELGAVCGWLAEAGLALVSSGIIDLGIIGEELFARATDLGTRTMGYWSIAKFSLYAVAVKSRDAPASHGLAG
jgi:methyltransferase family protein